MTEGDPRGYGADAPLFAAWLEFEADVEAADLAPFSFTRHKDGGDLFGDIVRGDAPLFAGLDTMKQSRGLLALASTDASRAMLQRDGEELVGRLVRLVAEARRRLSEVEGVTVLEGRPAGHPDGALAVDPAKLVLLIAGTGAHSHTIEDDLLADGITLEMADRDVLVPLVTVADDERSLSGLVEALTAAIGRHRGIPRPVTPSAAWSVESQPALTPREAFFATHETVDAEAAIGRVCAELIAPYPPGVPVLAPGETVTAGALDALRATRRDGGRIAYAADPTLDTIQVVAGVPPTLSGA